MLARIVHDTCRTTLVCVLEPNNKPNPKFILKRRFISASLTFRLVGGGRVDHYLGQIISSLRIVLNNRGSRFLVCRFMPRVSLSFRSC